MPVAAQDIATLSRLLDQALDLDAAQREAWLAALAPEHQRHEAQLRAMLAARSEGDGEGPLSTLPRLTADDDVARAGELVGPYRLLREIGRGGMGSVWLAERADGRFKRQVALKLPRLAWGAGLAERMAREREIGMLLEHPAIARLYDAGLDDRGRPYLALEYIDGQPLDAWCEAQTLDVRSRLQLFLQVVRAVAYAHGRLVVHRDLKPSNVLVSADGQAHLLDFGIAKLLGDAAPGEAGLTQQQGQVLTPHYAAPEQVAGQPITVACDVYSLGVLLYEVLTGTLPIAPKRSTLGAVEDAVLQGDAPLASSRVKDRALAKALRGEIDAILAKAMQREPGRRYATADALAQDIERHLSGETVAARPDSVMYRLRKSVRRHWVGVSAAAAVLVAVLSGSAVAVVQAQRAAQSAERERVVKEFVTDVFRVNADVNLNNAGVRPASARRLLEEGAQLIERRFSAQLDLQAELFGIVGDLCSTLGDHRLAASYASRRVETLSLLRAERTEQARAVLALASALYDARRFADAEPRARRGLELAAGNPSLEAEALMVLGGTHAYEGRPREARAALDAAQAKLLAAGSGPSVVAAKVRARQGLVLVKENRMNEALPLYRQGVDIAVAAQGPLSPAAASERLHVTALLFYAGRPADAAAELKDTLRILRSLGGAHAARAAFEDARFASFGGFGDPSLSYAENLTRIETSREALTHTTAPTPVWYVPQVEFWLGSLKTQMGDLAAGLPWMEANFDILYKHLDAPTDRFDQAARLASALQVTGRHDMADRWLREVVELRRAIGEETHPWAAWDKAAVATNLVMAGRLEEAGTLLDAIPAQQPVRGDADPDSINRMLSFARVRLLLARGSGQAALHQLQRSSYAPNPSADEGLLEDSQLTGEALCAARHLERGLVVLTEVTARLTIAAASNAPWLARARAVTGLCALEAGDRETAIKHANQARAAFVAQPGVSPYYKAPLFKLERALGLRLPAV